jgi:hypothetical protein
MPLKQKFKFFLTLLVLTNLSLSMANLAYGQSAASTTAYSGVSGTIEKYLCAPTEAPEDKGETDAYWGKSTAAEKNTAQNDLYNCINRIYKFAIAIGSAAGVMMIVVAGYMYMSSDGNQESVDKAKSILVSSITAMIILLSGYILLRFINPDLTRFKSIQPPSIKMEVATITPATLPPVPPGSLAEAGVRMILLDNGITVNAVAPQTRMDGIKQATINEIISLKKACNCEVVVTAGTEQGHSEGSCSHSGGFKADLRKNTALDNYIRTKFTPAPSWRDGTKVWTSSTGGKYADESSATGGPHWDVAVCQ